MSIDYGTILYLFLYICKIQSELYNCIVIRSFSTLKHRYHPTPTPAVVSCESLDPPANGQLELTNDNTLVNSEATYSCNSGFNLIGTVSRRCQATGEWTGQTPQCIGKHSVHATLGITM